MEEMAEAIGMGGLFIFPHQRADMACIDMVGGKIVAVNTIYIGFILNQAF
jgi:hypothetical protein